MKTWGGTFYQGLAAENLTVSRDCSTNEWLKNSFLLKANKKTAVKVQKQNCY